MSDIVGDGFGAAHDWRANTPQDNSKRTFYVCAVCGAQFVHHYDATPNVFAAIAQAGVANECKAAA